MFEFGFTVNDQVGSETVLLPSDTEMTMPLHTLAPSAKATPLSSPVADEKFIHGGRLTIENLSLSPSASVAFGLKL